MRRDRVDVAIALRVPAATARSGHVVRAFFKARQFVRTEYAADPNSLATRARRTTKCAISSSQPDYIVVSGYIGLITVKFSCAVRGFVRTYFLPSTRSDCGSCTTLHLFNIWTKHDRQFKFSSFLPFFASVVDLLSSKPTQFHQQLKQRSPATKVILCHLFLVVTSKRQ